MIPGVFARPFACCHTKRTLGNAIPLSPIVSQRFLQHVEDVGSRVVEPLKCRIYCKVPHQELEARCGFALVCLDYACFVAFSHTGDDEVEAITATCRRGVQRGTPAR